MARWKRHPKDWGAKNSAGQREAWANAPIANCIVCGTEFRKRIRTQSVCGYKCKYKRDTTQEPIKAKALTMSGSVRLGKGKSQFMQALLVAALHKPCVYCGTFITMENMSLDHVVPFGGLRGKPMGQALNKRENLQICCKRCNRGKGNLSDRAFRKLLEFLRTDPEISTYVWKRIAGGGVQFQAWRRKAGGKKL